MALAVLDVFVEEALLQRAQQLGWILRERLTTLQHTYDAVGDVRGLGEMLGLEIVSDRETKEPDEGRTRGLILLQRCGLHRNVIRLLAPLVTNDVEAHHAIDILDEAFAAALADGRTLSEALERI